MVHYSSVKERRKTQHSELIVTLNCEKEGTQLSPTKKFKGVSLPDYHIQHLHYCRIPSTLSHVMCSEK